MFHGSMVALATPMTLTGELDMQALQNLVEFHIENGTDAIVAVGTTGESPTVNVIEHIEIIKQVVAQVNNRVPVIAGTGANSTAEAIELTHEAKAVGADAVLLVTPYYNKPTQEGLYLHYKALAEKVAIPQILYNVPGRTAVDLLPETVARLSRISNIVGIKEATGDLHRARQIAELCDDDFERYSGDDLTSAEFLLEGGSGVISVTSNVAPKAMHDMCAAAKAGDVKAVKAIDATLVGLHNALFVESNPIPVKWVMHKMGLCSAGIRLPLTPLIEEHHETLLAAMKQAGIATIN